MSNKNWKKDKVQFARLLCEIVATQDKLDFRLLCLSMDLNREEVQELFDRAHEVWEAAKDKEFRVIYGPMCPHCISTNVRKNSIYEDWWSCCMCNRAFHWRAK